MFYGVPDTSGRLAAGDVDNDGRQDLVVSNAAGFTVMLNQGPFPKHAP